MAKNGDIANSYSEFLQGIEPVVLGLKSCQVDLDRKAFWQLVESPKKKGTRHFRSGCRVSEIKQDCFDLTATLTLEFLDPGAKSAPLRIRCDYEAHFHGRLVSAALVSRFAGAEARLFMWPYFREFVASTMGRMSIPPFLIPVSYSLPPVRPAKRSKTAAARS